MLVCVCVCAFNQIIFMCLWDIHVCLPAYFLCCEAMASLCGEGQYVVNHIWLMLLRMIVQTNILILAHVYKYVNS